MGAGVQNQRARRAKKFRVYGAIWPGEMGPRLEGWGEGRKQWMAVWVRESREPGWGLWIFKAGGCRDPPVSGEGLHRVLYCVAGKGPARWALKAADEAAASSSRSSRPLG